MKIRDGQITCSKSTAGGRTFYYANVWGDRPARRLCRTLLGFGVGFSRSDAIRRAKRNATGAES